MHEDKHNGVCCWAEVGRGEAAAVLGVVAWGGGHPVFTQFASRLAAPASGVEGSPH